MLRREHVERVISHIRRVDDKLSQVSWSHASVTTWCKNAQGRIVTHPPWRLVDS